MLLSEFPELRQSLENAGASATDLAKAEKVAKDTTTRLTTPGRSAEASYLKHVEDPAAAVRADELVSIPTGWSLEQASAATLVYLTAYQALTMWSDLPTGAVVLVTGASGGVGVASVQLAKAMGHTVVAQSRDLKKAERLRGLGADITLDPQDSNWRQQLKAALNGRKVDLAIDNIGGKLLPEVIDTLGHNARVSCVGALAGPVPSFNTASLFFRRIKLGGVSVGDYGPVEGKAAWANVLKLLDQAGAKPLVDPVFEFDQVPAAFARLKEGPMGKVVVRVKGD